MKLASPYRIALVSCACLYAACATNPVTGERQLALVSEAQEIEMGRAAAQDAEASIGLVDKPELQRYVSGVGLSLAADSERPKLPWKFAVVDDPTPNAFALPGGFVYVTRGLMDLMDSEAELASVLGHEIGHVTARHSVTMISRQQLAQFGLGLGGVLFPDLQPATQAIGAGLQLMFLRYGRDAERQADELGFRYAHEHDYQMSEMADVFQALAQSAQMEQASALPSWLTTHPAPEERIQEVNARIAAVGPAASGRVERIAYLRQIDGLVYGINPRNGFFRSNVFYQPDMRFRLSLPPGWQYANLTRAVVGASKDGAAAVQLTLARESSPGQAAQRFLSQQGLQSTAPAAREINGVPAVAAEFLAQADEGRVQGYALFLEHRGQVFQLLSYASAGAFPRYRDVLQQSAATFAPVSDPAILNVQPKRIDLVQLDRSLSLAGFNEQYPSSVPIQTLALVNQVRQPSAPIQSGTLMKRVVGPSGF